VGLAILHFDPVQVIHELKESKNHADHNRFSSIYVFVDSNETLTFKGAKCGELYREAFSETRPVMSNNRMHRIIDTDGPFERIAHCSLL